MVDFWKCPHCGSTNEKEPRQGDIVEYRGEDQILYRTTSPNNCPKCGEEVNGAAILSGHYDDNWAELKGGLKQGMIGLICLAWFIGAFWVFPFAFNQGLVWGIGCILLWISPLFWVLRRR